MTDGFLGVWTLNRDQSKYELGQPPQEGKYTIEPDDNGLKITMEWTTVQGQSFNQVYHSIPDGKSYPYPDNPAVDAFSTTLIDEKTLDTTATKGEAVVSYARRRLSDDGQTMIITMSGTTPQGDPYTNLAIYEKQ